MTEPLRSAQQMVNMFKDDATLLDRLKTTSDPIQLLQQTATDAMIRSNPAYLGDRPFYRIVVGVLGLLALIAAIGSIWLVAVSKMIPEVLVALGSTAVGALVGLFAPSPTSK